MSLSDIKLADDVQLYLFNTFDNICAAHIDPTTKLAIVWLGEPTCEAEAVPKPPPGVGFSLEIRYLSQNTEEGQMEKYGVDQKKVEELVELEVCENQEDARVKVASGEADDLIKTARAKKPKEE